MWPPSPPPPPPSVPPWEGEWGGATTSGSVFQVIKECNEPSKDFQQSVHSKHSSRNADFVEFFLRIWSFCSEKKLTWKNLPKFQHILNNLQYLAWKAWSVTYGVAGHVRGEISGEEVFSSCGHTRHKHGPWGGVGRCYVSGGAQHTLRIIK